MKPQLAIFYSRHEVGGGTTSFTVHLYRVLRDAGVDVRLYRFRAEDSKPRKPRNIAKYEGTPHEFVTQAEALKVVNSMPSLLVAHEHPRYLPKGVDLFKLIRAGMRVVIHDPFEFKYDHLKDQRYIIDPICIRVTMQRFYKTAVFIPHPYHREFEGHQGGDLDVRELAASIARITFVKRPEILMDANRLLPDGCKINFHGAENRMMTHFRFKDKYPEFKQGGYNLPFIWGVSARAVRSYAFMPDMTRFPNDGGGSQYSFMEAWDAGAVVIVNCDWLHCPGEMKDGYNCLAIANPRQLADLLMRAREDWEFHEEISANSTRHLDTVHNGLSIANQYLWTLTGSTL
jgi:hypothetical protein